VTDTTINDFPFVAELPKREKSKLAKVWDTFQELRAATAEHGSLVPTVMAANILGVSRQRVMQLVVDGKLISVCIHGQPFIGEKSLVEHARSERKTGRPFKIPETSGDMWRAGYAAARRKYTSK
jgi:hypothetical protein